MNEDQWLNLRKGTRIMTEDEEYGLSCIALEFG
jgi:hypothetical protein